MSVKNAITAISGWDALNLDGDELRQKNVANAEQVRELNKLMHRAFAQSPDGKKALEVLVGWTLAKPVADPHRPESFAYFREGQNDIVRSILRAIEAAEKGA